LSAPKVDIGGREIAQAFVIALMIVVLDEGIELASPAAPESIWSTTVRITASLSAKNTHRRPRGDIMK
jgi:hypothetical protein